MKTVKSPFQFPGGVHPRYHKDLTEEKPIEERDKQKEFNLMYAQFMQGLRLSTGMRW